MPFAGTQQQPENWYGGGHSCNREHSRRWGPYIFISWLEKCRSVWSFAWRLLHAKAYHAAAQLQATSPLVIPLFHVCFQASSVCMLSSAISSGIRVAYDRPHFPRECRCPNRLLRIPLCMLTHIFFWRFIDRMIVPGSLVCLNSGTHPLYVLRSSPAAEEAQVALTREAGKNAKLAALLGEAGISCVEVKKQREGPPQPSSLHYDINIDSSARHEQRRTWHKCQTYYVCYTRTHMQTFCPPC